MLRAASLALGLMFGTTAIAQTVTSPAWTPLEAHARLLAFGDSLTDGIGGSGESYPLRLSRLIGHDVVSAGVPGETSAEGLRRLPAVLDRERPAVLILCLGINDLLRGVDADTIRDHLVAMVQFASGRGIPTLLLAVPQPGRTQAHPLFDEVAARSGARLEAHAMVDVLANPAMKAGLVHPNRDGYRLVAEALARRLRDEALVR